MKNRVKKTIFTVIAVLLAAVILEVCFRVIYSLKYDNFAYMTYGWDYLRLSRFDVNYFNGYAKLSRTPRKEDVLYLGFRTAPFSIRKPEGEYRVVALGGSSTYGFYDGYRQSWPYLLQEKLNRGSGGGKYKVINAGISSQTLYGIHRLLIHEALDWEPDCVVLYSLWNQTKIDVFAWSARECKADKFFRLLKALFYEKSLIATHLLDRISFRREGVIKNKLTSYRYLYSDIIERCKKRGIDVILVKQLVDPKYFAGIRHDVNPENIKKDPLTLYNKFLDIIDEIGKEYHCKVVDEISDMLDKKILRQLPGKGRSAHYDLIWPRELDNN